MLTGLLGALVHILVLVLVYFLVIWGAQALSIAIPAMVLKIFAVILVILGIITILNAISVF